MRGRRVLSRGLENKKKEIAKKEEKPPTKLKEFVCPVLNSEKLANRVSNSMRLAN